MYAKGIKAAISALCLAACVTFFSARCYAQEQTSLGVAPTANPAALSSQQIEDITSKLATEIAQGKLKTIVVVGAAGPKDNITELGVSLVTEVTASLAQKSGRFKVIDAVAVRDFLRQNRIAADMLYSNVLAQWIADHVKADGYVSLRLGFLSDPNATITARLFCHGPNNKFVLMASFDVNLRLSESQFQSAELKHDAALKMPVVTSSAAGYSMARCVHCPPPRYSDQARSEHVEGVVMLQVTVTTEGIADDILVVKPVGAGLDAAAVEGIRGWKFKPATDPKGNSAAMRVPIEVTFQLYTGKQP